MTHHAFGGAFIDGAFEPGAGAPLRVIDPATADEVAFAGASASAAQVGRACAAARRAFRAWARTSFEERAAVARAFKALLIAHKAALSALISREMGKLAWEAQAELDAMAGKIEISITAYQDRTGEKTLTAPFGAQRLVHRPHGVLAVLGPFNFPGHLPNGHIVPALLAGNCVVFKPSEYAPSIGLAMADLWAQAGLPAGVLTLVLGGRDVGEALLGDPEIDGVLFTGAPHTGAAIARRFADRAHFILALEMGGNNPLIVWDCEDAQAAASLIVHSAFITTGQRCSCARRLILPTGEVGDRVLEALAAVTGRLRIGAAADAAPAFMGPLAHQRAKTAVDQACAAALARGGRWIVAGDAPDRPGAFVAPRVIDMTDADREDAEIFGPVLQVERVSNFNAGLQAANATRFGLAAGLISDNQALWDAFVVDIRAGVVNWNRPTTGASSALPFGGPGLSGNHRPSAYYAADYCAWPMARQEAPTPQIMPTIGLADGE